MFQKRKIILQLKSIHFVKQCFSLYKNKVLPLMSAGANWEIFGEKVLVFVNWGSCNHCFQNGLSWENFKFLKFFETDHNLDRTCLEFKSKYHLPNDVKKGFGRYDFVFGRLAVLTQRQKDFTEFFRHYRTWNEKLWIWKTRQTNWKVECQKPFHKFFYGTAQWLKWPLWKVVFCFGK